MANNNKIYRKSEQRISEVRPTKDKLRGRTGLAFFVAYLHTIQIFPMLDRMFGSTRKRKKGFEITELFKQMFCFLLDGTSRHLIYFDHLKKGSGYTGSIETDQDDMAPSHTIKRFSRGSPLSVSIFFCRLL